MIIISQSHKVITPHKTANNIQATVIQIKRNNIQIKANKQPKNVLDIR